MPGKAFPVLYVTSVRRSVEFYALLGYETRYQFPLEGDPHYVGLDRGDSSLGIADSNWPEAQLGITVGTAPRFELFVYVDDVEAEVETFRAAGYTILQEPATMPWGERQAYLADPEGNPVALATPI
ncbi:bleomycin resistance protein [Kribbella sandramycini]|uniref:Bleomycin resistance protein n=1 Tax=Kribbella sandramycini TaxID=60450 RepID=A0A7Y4NYP7_9ACTN|nr:VOC family protein [Kribbella sandramycini]MBB6568963.1 lactoylglutathione lyase [Kribbella sandramycini]NOL41192.1 bleomycin resistance protein [Kribbella sandramycini]